MSGLYNPDYHIEPLLLEMLVCAKAAGVLPQEFEIDQDEILNSQRYHILVAATRAIWYQSPDREEELLHDLINLQFPLESPWCPVYLPPQRAGTYLLARAYAPHMPASALWRPARGFAWGRWYPPSGKHIALPPLPGDRWRAI